MVSPKKSSKTTRVLRNIGVASWGSVQMCLPKPRGIAVWCVRYVWTRCGELKTDISDSESAGRMRKAFRSLDKLAETVSQSRPITKATTMRRSSHWRSRTAVSTEAFSEAIYTKPHPVSCSRYVPGDKTQNDKDCRYYDESDVRCSYSVTLVRVETKARFADWRCLVGHGFDGVNYTKDLMRMLESWHRTMLSLSASPHDLTVWQASIKHGQSGSYRFAT